MKTLLRVSDESLVTHSRVQILDVYTERWPDAQSGESLHSPAGAPSLRSRCLHHLQCENLGSIYLLEQSKTGVGVNGKRVRAASPYFPQRAHTSISTRCIGSPRVSCKSFRACGACMNNSASLPRPSHRYSHGGALHQPGCLRVLLSLQSSQAG